MSLTMRYAHEFGMCVCACKRESTRARTRLFTHESRTKTRLNWHCLLLILLSSHTRRVPTRSFTQYTSISSLSHSFSLHLPFSLLHSRLCFRSHFCHPPPSGRMNTNKKKDRKISEPKNSTQAVISIFIPSVIFSEKKSRGATKMSHRNNKNKTINFLCENFSLLLRVSLRRWLANSFHSSMSNDTDVIVSSLCFVSNHFDWPENEFTSFFDNDDNGGKTKTNKTRKPARNFVNEQNENWTPNDAWHNHFNTPTNKRNKKNHHNRTKTPSYFSLSFFTAVFNFSLTFASAMQRFA